MKNKIIELISKHGPIVPTDISKELGIDSYVVSAIISELIQSGNVFYSYKKMSNGPLYYLKGQEDLVRKRLLPILKIPELKVLDILTSNKLVLKDNLEPQQRYIIDELLDFVKPLTLHINGEDKIFYKHYSISDNDVIEKFNVWKNSQMQNKSSHKEKEVIIEKKQNPIENNIKKQETLIVEKNTSLNYEKADTLSDNFFRNNSFEIIESTVVKKSSEYDFVAKQDNDIGQIFFVRYFKKNSISDSDISKAFAVSQGKKMPCIILTKGKISKKAQELIVNLGYLINVIRL